MDPEVALTRGLREARAKTVRGVSASASRKKLRAGFFGALAAEAPARCVLIDAATRMPTRLLRRLQIQ